MFHFLVFTSLQTIGILEVANGVVPDEVLLLWLLIIDLIVLKQTTQDLEPALLLHLDLLLLGVEFGGDDVHRLDGSHASPLTWVRLERDKVVGSFPAGPSVRLNNARAPSPSPSVCPSRLAPILLFHHSVRGTIAVWSFAFTDRALAVSLVILLAPALVETLVRAPFVGL